MKKKLTVIALAFVLLFSLSSVSLAAPPTGTPIPIIGAKALPADEALYHTNTYDSTTPEYASFSAYIGGLNENQQIVTVMGLNVYNSTSDTLMPGTNYAALPPDDVPYIFSIADFIPGYNPMQGVDYNVYIFDENLQGGSWRYLSSDPANVLTKYGFGVFAVFLDADKPLNFTEIEYDATNKSAQISLYKRNTYGDATQEWTTFQDYITQNKIAGGISEVWQLNAWDSLDRVWIDNNQDLAAFGMSAPYSVQTQMPGYTVLYQPQLGAPIQVLGDGVAVTTSEGFGLFAFVQPLTVSLNPTVLSLNVGSTSQITGTVSHNVAAAEWVWASSNPAVATVDANGMVTAVSAGTATITLTVRGVSASAQVTVAAPAPAPTPSSTTATSPQTGVYI